MVKQTTKAVQDQLFQLGKDLGFYSLKEYTFKSIINAYAPRYDVVWMLNVQTLNLNSLDHLQLIEGKYLPFAAFELEGSTTSSKNQVGNVGNLQLSPCYYNFMVVNNASAAKENDTYRRGMKIVRSLQRVNGERQLFFLDSSMLKKLPIFTKTTIVPLINRENRLPRKKGSGGEKQSILVAAKLMPKLLLTDLDIAYDRKPDYFKWIYHIDQKFQQIKVPVKSKYLLKQSFTKSPVPLLKGEVKSASDYYYIPEIDVAAGFSIEGGYVQFLHFLAQRIGADVIHFPFLQYLLDIQEETIYFPLLGIEIEISESKHALGGLINLANFQYVGWLVSPGTMKPYVETYKHHLGMQNVHHIEVEEYLV
ncbi:hypothetical protein [Planococcus koreensis]|nr:hypothetical protein [Planococcus koreensis]